VDDNDDLRLVTATYLRAHAYEVYEAADAAGARRMFGEVQPDAVVLDLGLPDDDGLNVVREIRVKTTTPVLVVSGRDTVGDRIAGLDLGADDYLVKPFSHPELGARLNAVLRRSRMLESQPRGPVSTLTFGPLRIDSAGHKAAVDGRDVPLTRLEFALLAFLARSPGRSFTYEKLLRSVWGSSAGAQSEKTVSEHVYRLRNKLALPQPGPAITTVRGVGYRFDP
jgi:DNA-binding response OmpR family regulator